VAGNSSNTVYVYPASASGTVSPSRRLSFVGASTRGDAEGISAGSCLVISAYVDGKGNLYVSSF
jgi:hypothetical protein